jgi:hypothetical protein
LWRAVGHHGSAGLMCMITRTQRISRLYVYTPNSSVLLHEKNVRLIKRKDVTWTCLVCPPRLKYGENSGWRNILGSNMVSKYIHHSQEFV